jgi:hypothetical protein
MGSIFTMPHFLKYLHKVDAALSLFVSLPIFIRLETVVNGIKILGWYRSLTRIQVQRHCY